MLSTEPGRFAEAPRGTLVYIIDLDLHAEARRTEVNDSLARVARARWRAARAGWRAIVDTSSPSYDGFLASRPQVLAGGPITTRSTELDLFGTVSALRITGFRASRTTNKGTLACCREGPGHARRNTKT